MASRPSQSHLHPQLRLHLPHPQTPRSAIHPPQILGMERRLDGPRTGSRKHMDSNTGFKGANWKTET
jgi:hypothetical protein